MNFKFPSFKMGMHEKLATFSLVVINGNVNLPVPTPVLHVSKLIAYIHLFRSVL